MYQLSRVLLLFPLFSARFEDEFVELNLGSALEVILKATSSYFQGFLAELLMVLMEQMCFHINDNNDDKNNSNHQFYHCICINQENQYFIKWTTLVG